MADIYSKEKALVSIHLIPQNLLSELLIEEDSIVESKRNAVQFALSLISEQDLRIVFFKYFQGNSLMSMKKTVGVGSTKTLVKHTKRLENAIREYIRYYEKADWERDRKMLECKIDRNHSIVAELLFKRWSYTMIMSREDIGFKRGVRSRKRLMSMIERIELTCLTNNAEEFWNVIFKLKNFKLK